MDIYEKSTDALSYLLNFIPRNPDVAVILGTGLGNFVDALEDTTQIPYGSIPHFPESTVPGHNGVLVHGTLGPTSVLALSGRFHYYEGYSMKELTFPIRLLYRLGISNLIITNISGGLNPEFRMGDLVLIKDHINLFGDSPLIGDNDDRFGPRFPDMSQAYDHDLMNTASLCAKELSISLHEGVYAGLHGPSLETPAEYSYLHKIGADCVGMSTVPEVIVARHMDMKVCAISLISNQCYPPDEIKATSLEEILEGVNRANPQLKKLLIKIVKQGFK